MPRVATLVVGGVSHGPNGAHGDDNGCKWVVRIDVWLHASRFAASRPRHTRVKKWSAAPSS